MNPPSLSWLEGERGKSWTLERGPSSQNCRNAFNCRIVGRRRSIVDLEGDGRGGGGAATIDGIEGERGKGGDAAQGSW